MDILIQGLQSLPIGTLFFISSLLLFLLGLVFRSRGRKPFPPGPKGLPIIGNMTMMDQLNCRGLAKLAKQYGGIFHLRMGYLHIMVVSSPDVARQVLQVHDNVFSNRPANIATTCLTYDRADVAFANYGPFWRQMRKLCVMKLFSNKRAESWNSVPDLVDSTARTVAASAGTEVNIGGLVYALTRNIVYRAAFGTSVQEKQDEFFKILREFSKLFGAFNIADFIPWLGWIDPQGGVFNRRLAKARQSLDRFIDKIIDDHIEKKAMNNNNGSQSHAHDPQTDIVDDLIANYGEDDEVLEKFQDSKNSIKLTRENVKGIIMDLMFGGTETVGSAIEWTLSELLKSPEDLKKVQKELDDVVGLERRLEEGDLEKLIYLKCVIKETLRLHPPFPFLLHETSEDAEVAGYYVPKKCRIMINVWAMGRDANYWDDAEAFKPSRFLKDVRDLKGNHFEYIPFGSGRRSCPAMKVSLFALELAVGHLLHCFTWELPGGMEAGQLDMNAVFGLSASRATRLVAVPTKRILCPL
ncbi:cytochrome P450 84A1 [Ziziphus jujuba]|uniref:Cytochrome P450 84A1 n=1 Tax=Ziziphus jujuba TaxID=326968 RepID=A0A6P4AYV6_ZIZJJ|nr:cytochrome P450 84A1 [Ziziphus jujuba]